MAKLIHEIAAPFKYDEHSRPDGWLHRVITHAGGMAELWDWEYENVSEVVNDIDGNLINFWRVLQNETAFASFRRIIEATPFSEERFFEAKEQLCIKGDSMLKAVAFFIVARQSMAGRLKGFTPLTKTRTRRGMNAETSAWISSIEGLPEVHERLKRIILLNQDALEVLRTQDGERTLFYLDPPYFPTSRATPNVYDNEMSVEQHKQLLDVLGQIKGRFILSGYDNECYAAKEAEYQWNRHTKVCPNNAASGETKKKMTEVLWTNF